MEVRMSGAVCFSGNFNRFDKTQCWKLFAQKQFFPSPIHPIERCPQFCEFAVSDCQCHKDPASRRKCLLNFRQRLIKSRPPHKLSPPLTNCTMPNPAKSSFPQFELYLT